MDARVGHRVDHGGGAAARQLGQQRQHVAGGRVACRDVGDVDEAIPDRIEGAGRRGRMLRQHLQLDPAVGGLLHLLAPDRQHVFGQQMARRHPARHGEGGLSSSGLRQDRECRSGHDGRSRESCAGKTGHGRYPPKVLVAPSGHLRMAPSRPIRTSRAAKGAKRSRPITRAAKRQRRHGSRPPRAPDRPAWRISPARRRGAPAGAAHRRRGGRPARSAGS